METAEPNPPRLFAIADTHFTHRRILDYSRRPFDSIEAMDEALIEAWNEQVRDEDLVFHLGDFGLGTRAQTKAIVARLRGRKILILGNHDRGYTVSWWKRAGFEAAYKSPVRYGLYLFSHEPMEVVPEGLLNVHGHLHEHPAAADGRHLCVSVEQTGFRPLLLGWVRTGDEVVPYTEGYIDATV